MKDNSVVDVGSELRTVQLEFIAAENREAELRAELRPLVEQKIEAEMNGKKLAPQKERQLSILRSKLDEASEILEAKRERVRQLHLLAVSKDVEAARQRQRKYVAEAVAESEKVSSILRELESIRKRIDGIADAECLFIRSVNAQLGLEGRDRLQERLRHNTGGIIPPSMPDAGVWTEYAQRLCNNLADF
jgi:Fic family protein